MANCPASCGGKQTSEGCLGKETVKGRHVDSSFNKRIGRRNKFKRQKDISWPRGTAAERGQGRFLWYYGSRLRIRGEKWGDRGAERASERARKRKRERESLAWVENSLWPD